MTQRTTRLLAAATLLAVAPASLGRAADQRLAVSRGSSIGGATVKRVFQGYGRGPQGCPA